MKKIPPHTQVPLVFLAVLALGFFLLMTLPETKKEKEEDVPIGGPFTLLDSAGVTRTNADFPGQYLLVFFGYTFCPDVCPITLQTVGSALDRLGKQAEKVTPIFITVDPERDTPERMGKYVSSFHPRLVGLSGSNEQIAAVAKAYRVYYAKSGEDEDYLLDHSAILFFMSPDGRYLTHFRSDDSAEKMAAGMSGFLE